MTKPDPPDRGGKEPSLLDDASTLLMFSKGSNESSKNSSTCSQSSQYQQPILPYSALPLSRTSTRGGIAPANPQASPGPASVALMHNESSSLRDQGHIDPSSHQYPGGQEHADDKDDKGKGMVAAAALAAAATVPLPLKSRSRTGSDVKNEWPVPESYIVDIDSGVITCICGFDDDDGFTIQCDHCNRWQHAICYNIKNIETAPDDYLCNVCHPRRLDVRRAKRKQLERLQRHRQVPSSHGATGQETELENGATGSSVRAGPRDHDERNYEERKSTSTANGSTEKSEEATSGDDERKKKRKHEEALDEVKRNKDVPIYLNAKDAYSEIYLPTETYDFRDKYVKMFIDKHNDDDWVIPYNGDSFKPAPLEVRSYADSNSSKAFTGFSKLGVHVGKPCDKGEFLCEYLGEVDFQRKYLVDPRNHYRIWGTTKVHVIFHPHWPLYIDARLTGNLTRYVRRSCNPNVELATIRLTGSDEVKFVLRSKRDLQEGEEIHLDWHWDLRHPVWQLIKGTATLDSLNDPDKYLLIHSIDAILSTCDCACGNSKECVLHKVKKFSQVLYRSVRSKMNNRYKLNEILNHYQGKKRRQPAILDRLTAEITRNEERAAHVLAGFHAKRLHFVGSDRNQVYKGNMVKPYKWRLVESPAGVIDRSVGPAQIKSPLEYDESKVNDLQMLPIPIVLEVPLPTNDPSKSSIKVDAALRTADLPLHSDIRVQETGQKFITHERGNSHISLTDLADKRPTKKKLSFADYRKKQYK